MFQSVSLNKQHRIASHHSDGTHVHAEARMHASVVRLARSTRVYQLVRYKCAVRLTPADGPHKQLIAHAQLTAARARQNTTKMSNFTMCESITLTCMPFALTACADGAPHVASS
jgi:hypothetical protein